MPEPAFSAKVDWNGDGDWSDAGEDISGDLLAVEYGAGRSAATDEFSAGQCRLTVENAEGKYSRFNAASPLSGLLRPGRELILEATHNALLHPCFRGRLTDFTESIGGPDGIPTVELSFVDGMDELRLGEVRTELLVNPRVDEAIAAILDAAGWPAGLRSLDVAVSRLAVHWVWGQAPLPALQAAGKQELGGQSYVNKSGEWRFENRHYRSARPLYATVTDAASLELGFRRDDLYSDVRVSRAGLSEDAASSVIYELTPGWHQLDPGSSSPRNTIIGKFSSPARDVIAPVVVTDFQANGAADGSGTDKTAQVTLASWTVWGEGFKAVFDVLDASPVWLALQVRGTAIQRSNDERRIEVTAAAPIVTGQVLTDEFLFNDSVPEVDGYAHWRSATLSEDQPRPVVRLLAHSDAEIAVALGTEISHRVRLTNTTGLYPTHVDQDFFIEGYRIRWRPDQDLECEWRLFSRDQAMGSMFRFDHSALAAAGQNADRIGF